MTQNSQALNEAIKLLGIKRVALKPAAKQVSQRMADAISYDQDFWFAPNGDPIGIYTPAQGLAALRRCIKAIELERAS